MGTTYNPAIATDGLVLCLDAANKRSYPGTGTTWTDRSTSGNNVTLTNGPTFSSDNGGVISFDGSDDSIMANIGTSLVTGNGTLNIWLKWTAEKFAIFHVKSGYGGGNYSNGEYWGFRSGSNTDTSLIFHTGAGNGSTVNLNITIGAWSNLTLTYNGSGGSGKIYANGSYIQDVSWSAFNTPDGDVKFANGGYQTTGYSGEYGLINMYNRQLAADEVRQNYEATVGRYT